MNAISASIVVDNLNFFATHYQQEEKYTLLQRACLCGAEKIGEYLLERCEIAQEEMHFFLSYITSSPNEEWALKIANLMHSKNMPIHPDEFDECPSKEIVERIKHILYPMKSQSKAQG